MEEPFPARVKRLAAERDLSVSKVGYMAYDPDVKGTNPDTFKSVMAGRRPVAVPIVEAVARVLRVPPDEFPEYRLLIARRQLDEREVGLEQALDNLSRFEAARRQSARAPGRRASERTQATPKPTPKDPPARRKRTAT